jgi:hypothetical protein
MAQIKTPVNSCIYTNNIINPTLFATHQIRYNTKTRTATLAGIELTAFDQGARITYGENTIKYNACLYLTLAFFYNVKSQGRVLDQKSSALYLIRKLFPDPDAECVTSDHMIIEKFVKFTQKRNKLGVGISVLVFWKNKNLIELFYDGWFDPERVITIEFDDYGVGHFVPMVILEDTPTVNIDSFFNLPTY